MGKYKVGDKVRVIRDLKANESYGEDKNNWNYTDEMLERVEYTYEDLKKSPIGTKLNFENGYIIKVTDKRNYGYSNNIDYKSTLNNTICLLENNMKNSYFGKLISIEEPNYITIYEPEKEILDEVEKRYLRGVIRPFRNKVKYIKLIHKVNKIEGYININLEDEQINLPYFNINSMYKGMEPNKEYNLKELGL